MLTAEFSARINATPEACFAALADVERMPEWQSGLREAAVLARTPRGLPRTVAYRAAVGPITVSFTVDHAYERPWAVTSNYVRGDLRSLEAAWRFAASGSGTDATMQVAVDPGPVGSVPFAGAAARRAGAAPAPV
mgnify:CR=1 FL=1